MAESQWRLPKYEFPYHSFLCDVPLLNMFLFHVAPYPTPKYQLPYLYTVYTHVLAFGGYEIVGKDKIFIFCL